MNIHVVAVLDDNLDDREMTSMAVEEAGFEPLIVDVGMGLEETVALIRKKADALVSDHHLQWGASSRYSGAELVNRCYEAGFPAVLVTAYMMDVNSSIRLFRRGVPQLVPRNDLDGECLRRALEIASLELSDAPSPQRAPHRALVRIDRVIQETDQLDVVVPQWNPHARVSIPAGLVGDVGGRTVALEGRRYFAMVNTGAETESELYFVDFEDAGPVPDESELT